MASDPAGFAAGQSNLYEYVGNDPTNGTDPSGLAVDVALAPPPSGTNTVGSQQIGPPPPPPPVTTDWWYKTAWLYDKVTFGIGTSVIISEPYGVALNATDQFFAGFAGQITGGATTRRRAEWYGDVAIRNHHGTAFDAGVAAGKTHQVVTVLAGVGAVGSSITSVGSAGAVSQSGLSVGVGAVTVDGAVALPGIGAIGLTGGAVISNSGPGGGDGGSTGGNSGGNLANKIAEIKQTMEAIESMVDNVETAMEQSTSLQEDMLLDQEYDNLLARWQVLNEQLNRLTGANPN
jgi:hypothetical protein